MSAKAVFRTARAAKPYDRGANAVDLEGLLFLASRRSGQLLPKRVKAKGLRSCRVQARRPGTCEVGSGQAQILTGSARTIGEHGLAHVLGGPAVVFRGRQTLPLARPLLLPPIGLRSSTG
jgi:hypothetical protein